MVKQKFELIMYDSLTNRTVKVVVNENVYRTFTRHASQTKYRNKKFNANELPFSSLIGANENNQIEDFKEFSDRSEIPEEVAVLDEFYKEIGEAISTLSKEEIELLYAFYIREDKLKDYAKKNGIGISTAHLRREKVLAKLLTILK